MSEVSQNTSTPLIEAYKQADHSLRITRARVGYVLSLALVPAGCSLDYFVYPHLLWPIMKVRVLCDLALLPWFILAFTRIGTRYIRITDKPCAILPMLSICWMIYASQGAISPYYAGLNLIMVGVCLVMPYTLKEGALFCGFVVAAYAGACVLNRIYDPEATTGINASSQLPSLYNNLYFLALNSIICVTACYYSTKRRFEDFSLRHALAVNNRELAATLKKLRETEVQLVQSEKMNALGKLSAGLLHEVNNPLNFTFMALQMAEQEAEGNDSLKETLSDIGQGMERIRSVISDLRAFAYPTKPTDREVFSLEEALTTALRLTAHELGDIPVDRSGICADKAAGSKTHIAHVLMNLLVNSAQAMKGKSLGREPKIWISCQPRNDRLEVVVRDNGTGVKPEHLPKLFDPFFTTKDVGQGMGLGLSICHTIVKNHGGNITMTSEEGSWAQVTFDLPLANAPSGVKPAESPSDTAHTDEPEAAAELVGSTV